MINAEAGDTIEEGSYYGRLHTLNQILWKRLEIHTNKNREYTRTISSLYISPISLIYNNTLQDNLLIDNSYRTTSYKKHLLWDSLL